MAYTARVDHVQHNSLSVIRPRSKVMSDRTPIRTCPTRHRRASHRRTQCITLNMLPCFMTHPPRLLPSPTRTTAANVLSRQASLHGNQPYTATKRVSTASQRARQQCQQHTSSMSSSHVCSTIGKHSHGDLLDQGHQQHPLAIQSKHGATNHLARAVVKWPVHRSCTLGHDDARTDLMSPPPAVAVLSATAHASSALRRYWNADSSTNSGGIAMDMSEENLPRHHREPCRQHVGEHGFHGRRTQKLKHHRHTRVVQCSDQRRVCTYDHSGALAARCRVGRPC